MIRRAGTFLLIFAAPVARLLQSSPPAGDGATRPAKYYTSPDLEATVWATSPMLHNPTNIDCDARGRIWVAEAVNYRGFNTKNGNPLWREKGDRIVILEDSDGDGRADKTQIFVEDKDLVAPLGIAVIGNRVFVSCSPNLILYTDINENGVFEPAIDKKEIFLTGFGGLDHDHSLHALVGGPDGNYYLNVGNAGPHHVTDHAGNIVSSGSWYNGGSPYNTNNSPGLRGSDARLYTGGLAMKMNRAGGAMTVIGHNFRNSYELCADSFGNIWQNDNDDEISCRVSSLMPFGNAGYNSSDGTRSWQADRRPGQTLQNAHWHQDDPGVMPAGDIYGAGSPTGIVVYENGALGERYEGTILSCEAGRNLVWSLRANRDGAGFKFDRSIFVSSVEKDNINYVWSDAPRDPAKWFRPSDVCVGADGAIYVADWYDPIVGGHQMHDKFGEGSILRIAPKGNKPNIPTIDLTTPAGAARALASPAVHVRFVALEALLTFGERAVAPLEALLKDRNVYIRARALWALASLGEAGARRVETYLSDPDVNIRIAAHRALRASAGFLNSPAKLSKDPSPAARAEAALSLRGEKNLPLILQLAKSYNGGDRAFLESLGAGAQGIEKDLYHSIIEQEPADPAQWSDRAAELAWRLHPAEAVDALRVRAVSTSLNLIKRISAIDAIAFIPTKNAAEALLQLALSGPADTRDYAIWWIQNRDTNDWRTFDIAKYLPRDPARAAIPRGFPQPPRVAAFTSPILKNGFVNFNLDVSGAKHLWLVAFDTGDGNSCDWADWLEPELITNDTKIPLTSIDYDRATTGFGEIYKNANCARGPLRVDGTDAATGYGAHANSVILFNIPQSLQTAEPLFFRGMAGADRGGPTAGGSDHTSKSTTLQFAVYHDAPAAASKLTNDATSRPAPRAEDILTLRGDAARGKLVFFSKAGACSSCHVFAGEGRAVGPDLTDISKKYDRASLLQSITNPSAAILSGYETTVILTKTGETLSGFIIGDGETVILKDSTGANHAIARSEIAERYQQNISLMPENIANILDERRLADLLEYLAKK